MQADNGFPNQSTLVRARLLRASQDFSRWARGGYVVTSPSRGNLLNRGVAAAGQPQSAQSILEFLLVSVPLLALIFGILEIGFVFYESTNLDFAASEAARSVSVCANNCDVTNNGVLYRDYNMLQAINRTNIRVDNVEYIMLQHVGEQVDDPGQLPANTQNLGRAGPDIYADYKYQWQLYALPKPATSLPSGDPRANTVTARSTDPLNVKLADAKCTDLPLLTVSVTITNPSGCALAWQPYDDSFNGYRSNACASVTDDCRTNIPVSDKFGQQVVSGGVPQVTALWPGRYVCIPTDRFYVQIVYRHNWITPFMPTVNLDGKTQTLKGFSNTNGLIMSSKSYLKVEPRQFSGQSGQGGC